MVKNTLKSTLIVFDRQWNRITGGKNECISTRIGRKAWADNGGRNLPPSWRHWFGLARGIWYFLEWIDPGHCQRAYNSGV